MIPFYIDSSFVITKLTGELVMSMFCRISGINQLGRSLSYASHSKQCKNTLPKNMLILECVIEASAVKCQSIPSIDTLVDAPSTLRRHLGQQSVESWLIFYHFMWVGWHSACLSTVVRVLTECQSRYPSSINQDVDWGYQSKVSINTRSQMSLVHMIPYFYRSLTFFHHL